MSEHLFKFLLSEIAVIRIRCQNATCGATVEIPIHKLGDRFPTCACPLCHQQFDTDVSENGNLLQVFSEAVRKLKTVKDKVQIEFVLPLRDVK